MNFKLVFSSRVVCDMRDVSSQGRKKEKARVGKREEVYA
jgi:uncharacterized protein Veg